MRQGTLYAIVTNGQQWIIFRGLGNHYKPWSKYQSIVFNSLNDIRSNWGEFYCCISKNSVANGSLVNEFSDVSITPEFVGRPITVIQERRELSTALNTDSMMLFRHFFSDITKNDNGKMMQQCYVDDPRFHEYEKELQALLAEQRLPVDDNANVSELSKDILIDYIRSPYIDNQGKVVLVVGRVGAGKNNISSSILFRVRE